MNLQNLEDNRDDILKAEIGSLLFLIEKTFLSWWKNNGYFNSETPLYQQRNSEIKNILENSFKNIEIDVSKLMINYHESNNINLWQHFFKDWRKWRKPQPNIISSQLKILQKLYGTAEALNSGIEKGSPKENMQGDYPFIANSFGTFKDFSNPDKFDKTRDNYKNQIISFLEKMVNNNFDFENDRKDFFTLIKNIYSPLPSDTRFPLNDVTLWEQAYMATSMFKALLAGIYLKPINTNNYDLSKIRWTILAIQYDKLSLVQKGLKPAHISWYRKISKEIDNDINKMIEMKYALGNEIYRDETGIYFLVSENLLGEKERDFYKLHSNLDKVKNNILEIFYNKSDDEFYPTILLSEPTRATMNLTTFIKKAKDNFLKADYSKKNKTVKKPEKVFGICQVCKDRLVSKRDNDIPMCDICIERRKGRVNNWLESQDGETIWIDELADSNNRVALIGLKFELVEWLNGNLMSSFLGQKIDLSTLSYEDYINDIYNTLKNDKQLDETLYIKDYSENISPKNQPLRRIVETWFLERNIGTIYEKFLEENIPYTNKQFDWNNFNDDDDYKFLSKLILQFLLRKNPSPARLRRVWESSLDFMQEVKKEILDNIKDTRTQQSFKQKVPDFKDLDINDSEFKRYFTILEPTPISYQFIIPTQKVESFIDEVQKLYYEKFKYVNGKLPLHIGVVVQKSKDPLYVGIKALRNMRRDVKDWESLAKDEKLKDLNSYYKQEESDNNTKDFYSLYETDSFEYGFCRLPSDKGIKKYNHSDNFVVYPNTIDFEFLDTNSRRNDIYYKNGKRDEPSKLKTNRPYSWEEFEKFSAFREYFKDKSNELQTIVSLIYSKMEDWGEDEEESFKSFIKTTFKQRGINIENFGIRDCSIDEMKKFIDMFEFWHTTLKEI
jgi:RNA polymerase-binding transcription factor DksA